MLNVMRSKTDDDEPTELQKALQTCKQGFMSAGFFSLFINLLMLVPPLYMLQIYDRVLGSRSTETLYMLTLVVVGLFITLALLQVVRSALLVRIGNRMDQHLNTQLFSSMFRYAVDHPGRHSSQPISDLTSLRQFLTGQGMFAFFDGPWLPIYIGVLFLFHSWYGYFAILAVIILIILAVINEKLTAGLLGEANGQSIQSNQYAGACLRNAEVVHAMGMENNLRQKWLQRHLGFLSNQAQASDYAAIVTNLSKTLRLMFQSLMLGIGAYLAIHQEVTPGMIIAGSILLGRALAPLDLMIGSWKSFSSARSAYKRLNDLFHNYPATRDAMPLPPPKGQLSLEGVFLIPPGAQVPSLRGVGFNLEAGELLAVVGPSAAGKSSLARAVLGVWPLANGKVRLDGADVHQWDHLQLGPHVGYLPQDIELFEGTVSENICRFNEVDSNKVIAAAKLAGVHELILRLPHGYDTHITGEGGALSGGQRQRVGLARALYGDPSLVVLDEPNSNLDDQGEQALLNALDELKSKGTTVVLISHRKPILRLVDKILVLSEGLPVAFGGRDEVMQGLQDGSISLNGGNSGPRTLQGGRS